MIIYGRLFTGNFYINQVINIIKAIFAGVAMTNGYNLLQMFTEDRMIHNTDVNMQKRVILILVLLVLMPSVRCFGIEELEAGAFAGQDLHLRSEEVVSYQLSTGEHALAFGDGFSMSIGANEFFSNGAVVWLESVITEFRGRVGVDYNVTVYLEGNISIKRAKTAKTTKLRERIIEDGQSMVIRFNVSGEVFVTAEKREIADTRELDIYKRAVTLIRPAEAKLIAQPEAVVPEVPTKKVVQPEKPSRKVIAKPVEPATEIVAKPEKKEPRFTYPVNWASAGDVAPEIESAEDESGADIATIIGRIYVWQKQDERGGLLELEADNAVIFYSDEGGINTIYMSGDILITEGPRTIRGDQVYYDFQAKKAIVVNAVMRSFDAKRNMPIYVRAAKLRQVAENQFAGENITLTSSEFYKPQVSMTVSEIIITDTTTIDQQANKIADSSYDAQMRDIRMKVGKTTVFRWPFIRSNLQRPDIPLKSLHVGYDSGWGALVETRWHLARLLGLREPAGTDSTYALDYYGRRGVGTGAEIEYSRENYFGKLIGYVILDSGKDKLGRDRTRQDLDPPRKERGRFSWRHRHFLPYNWQLTTGIGYASDENFIEEYYRSEFNVGLGQETYAHLKRIENNWGLSFLGKTRLNDFVDVLEELPSAEFHLTGQSLFDDRFTLFNDTQVSRLRQRIGNEHTIPINENRFAFVSHRTELDMPFRAGPYKIVPFVAGTFAYDDRSGFTRTLVDGSNTGTFGDDKVWIGETGIRLFSQPLWKVYPDVKSRLWDLNQLRHIIKPQLTAVLYEESDRVIRQRDTLNIGISQRLQTKRGPAGEQRTVDWMRLDTDVTWVDDSDHDAGSSGADRFVWNKPFVPLGVFSAPQIFNRNLAAGFGKFELYGPRRNYFGADYIWRLSDTAMISSDMHFDIQSGVVQQFNIGFSRLVWPNLSYYIGSRYLRRVEILEEQGSNAFTFAVTYKLDPRYTLVLAQQFDFDYGDNIRSDITLIRQYHRMFCGFTYSADASLDRQAIVFSIWPQGVPELAIGQRRYVDMGASTGY